MNELSSTLQRAAWRAANGAMGAIPASFFLKLEDNNLEQVRAVAILAGFTGLTAGLKPIRKYLARKAGVTEV